MINLGRVQLGNSLAPHGVIPGVFGRQLVSSGCLVTGRDGWRVGVVDGRLSDSPSSMAVSRKSDPLMAGSSGLQARVFYKAQGEVARNLTSEVPQDHFQCILSVRQFTKASPDSRERDLDSSFQSKQ